MKQFWKTILTLSVLYLAMALILSPTACLSAAKDAIYLCLDLVIPSLFPFFLCSKLFFSLGISRLAHRLLSPCMYPLFGVSGHGAAALLLGLVSGYPMGASCVTSLYRQGLCSRTEAERLLTFCNNSGPLFILTAVGLGMLHHREAGILLYLTHLLSALLCGVLFRRYGKEKSPSPRLLPPATLPSPLPDLAGAIGSAVTESVEAMGKVCGFILLFSVFCAALPQGGPAPYLHPFLEITGGIPALLAEGTLPPTMVLPVIAFFLALSGLSVLLQTASFLHPAGLSLRPYLLGKLVQAPLAALLTALFAHCFPFVIPASLLFSPPTFLPTPKQFLFFVLLQLLACLILFLLFGLMDLFLRHHDKKKKDPH